MTLLHYQGQLHFGGPNRQLARARHAAQVSITDLRIDGAPPDRELTVTFQAEGERKRAERLLLRWAATTGYRRVWFSDRLVEVDQLPPLGQASTACNACGAAWAEQGADFWHMVLDCGHFPTMCPLCGGDLPQWTVGRPAKAPGGRRTGARTRSVHPSTDTRGRS